MIKRSFRFLALAFTLLALTSTVRTASAQSSCTDANSCVVTGGNPEPMGMMQIILTILSAVPLS